MHLIIAEKNLAGQRIAEILGGKTTRSQARGFAKYYTFSRGADENIVIPLRGHIVEVDFPKQYSYWKGTDLKELAKAPILYSPNDASIAALMKDLGKSATKVIIATDADREGESIGVEALRIVQEVNPSVNVERAYFSAMTPKELVKSFDELVHVDYNLSDSADARREIDLIWGAALTRFVSIMGNRMGKDFISVGRVQTPVLALIVNREKERLAFVVQPYWEIIAHAEKDSTTFDAFHKNGKMFDEHVARQIFEKIKDEKKALVKKVSKKKRMVARPIPFDTTTMLRAASALGFTAGQAMNTAESLYMAGYISYPRTDNQTYPSTMNLREHLEELKNDKTYAPFVDGILAAPLNPSKGPKNTTDHPPVHPTKVPERGKIGDKEWKFFDLVARRFLATFMPDAETENTSVELDIKSEPFAATGQTILFAGWKAVYPFSELKETILPTLHEGEFVPVNGIEMPRKETQPPARYSQSALLKLMEEQGLGTKCFHGDTLAKVFNGDKEKSISMTELFEYAKKTNFVHESAEIRENDCLECVGVSIGGETQKDVFPLISRRSTDPEKDKMKEVRFADGSVIQATDNHPILCYTNGELSYVPIFELRQGMQIASYHVMSQNVAQKKIEWSEFVSLCDEKTAIYVHEVSEMMVCARKSENLSQTNFAVKYGGHQANYVNYEKGTRPVPIGIFRNLNIVPKKISGVNNQSIIQNPFPMKVNPPLARILAKLIGDGSLDTEKVLKENCYDFRYTNTNPELLSEFSNDIEAIFGVKSALYVCLPKKNNKPKAAVKIPGVAGRILAMLFPDILSKRPWKDLPPELYPVFIGAFFDDEGHAVKKETKIFLSGTNHDALRDIQKMLFSLGIVSRLDEKQHKLYVSQRQSLFNFLEKIPITSTYKKKRLIELLSKNYLYNRATLPFFLFEKEMLRVLSKPHTAKELSQILAISKTAVVNHLRKLQKEKKVRKIVDGNNKDFPRTIKYISLVDLSQSGYALLGETAICPNFVTKTIVSIEDIPLPEFVYDITNNEERPSFVLSNNLVVHNSTRADIIQKLYARQYISGIKSIEPNQIAFAVIDSLEKHSRIVTEPKMTAELELEMDNVAVGKTKKTKVVDDSRVMLLQVLDQLLLNKNAISLDLKKALFAQDSMGKCPNCAQGKLVMRKAAATQKRFLGCDQFPNCRTTFPLPQKGTLSSTNKICPVCNKAPLIKLAGKKFKMEICVNYDCPSKDAWKKSLAEKENAPPSAVTTATPSSPAKSPANSPTPSSASPLSSLNRPRVFGPSFIPPKSPPSSPSSPAAKKPRVTRSSKKPRAPSS